MLDVLVIRVVFLLMESAPILTVMGSKVTSDEISCFHQISQGDGVYYKNIVYLCMLFIPTSSKAYLSHSFLLPT
jgi:hypothetical protein